jgi:hypothetical protein
MEMEKSGRPKNAHRRRAPNLRDPKIEAMTDYADKTSSPADQQNQGEPGPEQVPKQRTRGRFRKGQSGNPSGRRRGRVSKQTIAILVKTYGSPLEFLLQTMSDPKAKMADRLDAAKAAIGFVHRRLPEYSNDYCPPLEEPPPPSKAELANREAFNKQQAELAKQNGGWPPLRF